MALEGEGDFPAVWVAGAACRRRFVVDYSWVNAAGRIGLTSRTREVIDLLPRRFGVFVTSVVSPPILYAGERDLCLERCSGTRNPRGDRCLADCQLLRGHAQRHRCWRGSCTAAFSQALALAGGIPESVARTREQRQLANVQAAAVTRYTDPLVQRWRERFPPLWRCSSADFAASNPRGSQRLFPLLSSGTSRLDRHQICCGCGIWVDVLRTAQFCTVCADATCGEPEY